MRRNDKNVVKFSKTNNEDSLDRVMRDLMRDQRTKKQKNKKKFKKNEKKKKFGECEETTKML